MVVGVIVDVVRRCLEWTLSGCRRHIAAAVGLLFASMDCTGRIVLCVVWWCTSVAVGPAASCLCCSFEFVSNILVSICVLDTLRDTRMCPICVLPLTKVQLFDP